MPRRGEQQLAGGLVCYLPYEAADGWVSCGALEPKFWAALCNGVDRPDLIEAQFEAPGSDAWREVAEIFRSRTRAEWLAFNDEHDCCIEPVLDLDEALDSELVRAREMVVEMEQPRLGKVRQIGAPVKLSRTPADPTRPAPAFGEHTDEVLREAGYSAEEIASMRESGRGGGAERRRRALGVPRMSTAGTELLRMGELAEASGVPAPTIKHYLREGLLPEPVKTSRNMAYYPPEFVDRIRLIKRLQEKRFMPLKAIRAVLEEDPDRAEAMLDLEDQILDRALAAERSRTSAAEVRERYGVPAEVLDRLAELEVLTPNSRGYTPSDVTIIEAISRFRAGGYDEEIGFTVYDTLRYKTALEELVRQEVEVVMNRLAGEVPPERVVEMLEAGSQPLKDLIAALHTKLMVAELERHRAGRD